MGDVGGDGTRFIAWRCMRVYGAAMVLSGGFPGNMVLFFALPWSNRSDIQQYLLWIQISRFEMLSRIRVVQIEPREHVLYVSKQQIMQLSTGNIGYIMLLPHTTYHTRNVSSLQHRDT